MLVLYDEKRAGMDEDESVWELFRPPSEGDLARGRLASRLYLSKSFPNANRWSRDHGQPSRFATRVFDHYAPDASSSLTSFNREEHIITNVGTTRTQVKALVTREQGNIVDLWIQAVPATGDPRELLHLRRENVASFLDFMAHLRLVDPHDASSLRLDDETMSALLRDPSLATEVYAHNPGAIRAVIAHDAGARDVIAIAHRKAALDTFERLLSDDTYFASEQEQRSGPEAVWQSFFEANPWILGIGLTEQLLTSYDEEKLEKIVTGSDIGGPGKRVDALLRTAGAVKSMVFAEIKHHRTRLLGKEYRPGNYPPSAELAGAVAQSQGTVHAAVERLGHRLVESVDGFDLPGNFTYLVRPRSFVIAGQLGEFINESGGHHNSQITSFELFRRNTSEPEIVTFDELLERARWIVDVAASE